MQNPTLLSLGFKHRSYDNSHVKQIDSQFSIEVCDGKVFLLAAPIDMDIAGLELTEGLLSEFKEVMFKVKNSN